MRTKTYVYEDPTGGDNDAEITLADMFIPPEGIVVTDKTGERHLMNLHGVKDD